MQAQKESIPDRASVHAKKGDFGTKKQSCEAPISKQESHVLFWYVFSRDCLCSLFSIGGTLFCGGFRHTQVTLVSSTIT